MDHETVWGTNVEMACLAHMLNCPVYCYDASQRYHSRMGSLFSQLDVDRSILRDVGQRSLYLFC